MQILPNLGSTAMPIQPESHAYVTSRGTVPESADDLAGWVWFNLWQRRLWPYKELNVGDTLYWYDSTAHEIVWETKVVAVERFEYEDKTEVRQRLLKRFDVEPNEDPNFIESADAGFCLAYKVAPVRQVRLPRPNEFKFPQGGWLRCDDPIAKTWLSVLVVGRGDGRYADQLSRKANEADREGHFQPQNVLDERNRKLREIVERRGQPVFRAKLIDAYAGRCPVTGCDAVAALEAAHIAPYSGSASNHVSNGMLLRSDIHTLFDLQLIGIEPETMEVVVADSLLGTCYAELDGRTLRLPADPAERPSKAALQQRWNTFASSHGRAWF